MNPNVADLERQLTEKGIPPDLIAPFLTDLGSILAEDISLSLDEIDKKMNAKGWEGFQIDEHTLFSILLFMAKASMGTNLGEDPLGFRGCARIQGAS